MSHRYQIRPKGFYWSDELECDIPDQPHMVAIEETQEPTPTGLLDKRGNEIFRMPEPKQFGFTSGKRK